MIAERTLTSAKDPAVQVVVRLARPVLNEGGDYRCVYQIIGAGENVKRFAAGIDEFQALWLSFGIIESTLLSIQKKIGHVLLFDDEDPWFRFPWPPSVE